MAHCPVYARWRLAADRLSADKSADWYFKSRTVARVDEGQLITHRARMLSRMAAACGEMDDDLGFLTRLAELGSGGRFLDLCAAPGGFTAETLRRAPLSLGTVVSLPESAGGLVLLLTEEQQRSCSVLRRDVTRLAEDGLSYACDVAYADGLPTERGGTHEFFEGWRALMAAQLSLALKNLRPGGALVLRTCLTLRMPDAHILCLLRPMFGAAAAQKPRTSGRALVSTCFVVFSDYCGSGHEDSGAAIARADAVLQGTGEFCDDEAVEESSDWLASLLSPSWSAYAVEVERFHAGVREPQPGGEAPWRRNTAEATPGGGASWRRKSPETTPAAESPWRRKSPEASPVTESPWRRMAAPPRAAPRAQYFATRPKEPVAEVCSHYMRLGECKFEQLYPGKGKCKFMHPPR